MKTNERGRLGGLCNLAFNCWLCAPEFPENKDKRVG